MNWSIVKEILGILLQVADTIEATHGPDPANAVRAKVAEATAKIPAEG